jgi:hypothetical protein
MELDAIWLAASGEKNRDEWTFLDMQLRPA